MRSSFMGLEIARRGLFAQQSALYTTSQNVSNANTPGYSRQRVNFNQTSPYPSVGLESPAMPGQMGTGVEAGTVQRIRESFLDVQYRGENNKVGYYNSLSESLMKMEGIMNEPTESGLQSTLDKFWSALQDLTTQTENSGARDVVAATGQMVTETLNYYYNSVKQVQNDIGSQIDVKVQEINSIIANIHNLNEQIADVEPHGYLPNDLYDARDVLVDQLSGLVNIKVSNVVPNEYGKALKIAEGLYNIEMVQKDGSSFNPPIHLVSVTKASGIIGTNSLEISKDPESDLITGVKVGKQVLTDTSFFGALGGYMESYGYISDGEAKGIYPDMLRKLDLMTEAFANEFNKIHRDGHALGATDPSGMNFFEFDPTNPAQSIKVSAQIVNNSNLIAAGIGNGLSGNNENAQKLSEIMKKSFDKYESFSSTNPKPSELIGSLASFYAGMIGQMGVKSQSAQKDLANSATLANSVDMNRQSVSAVSLDEELTNMIKFQQAYSSSARMLTAMDEMLDKVINGMGTVGR